MFRAKKKKKKGVQGQEKWSVVTELADIIKTVSMNKMKTHQFLYVLYALYIYIQLYIYK